MYSVQDSILRVAHCVNVVIDTKIVINKAIFWSRIKIRAEDVHSIILDCRLTAVYVVHIAIIIFNFIEYHWMMIFIGHKPRFPNIKSRE